jgi:PAS domain S-box-containing protein
MTAPERPTDSVEASGLELPASARESEERLRALLEDTPLLICTFLPDGEIVFVNRAYCEYFGKTRKELVGSSFLLLVPDESREAVLANILTLTADSPMQSHDHQVIAPGGEIRWQRWRNHALFDAEGQALIYHSFGEDITAQRRADEALLAANRALTMLTKCNQSLVRATTENELLASICGILVGEGGYRLAWVGFAEQDDAKSVRPVAHDGHDAGYLAGLDISWADTTRGWGPTGTAIRTRKPVATRSILTSPDFAPWRAAALEHGYASSIALPLMAGEQAFGALNVYSSKPDAFDEHEARLLSELADDVAYGIVALRTRQKQNQTEAALRSSKELLDESQRVGRLGSYALDVATGTWVGSDALDEVLGIPPDHRKDVQGWLDLVHPDDRERMREYLSDHVLGRHEPFDQEYRVRRLSDGSTRWVHGRGSLESSSSGELVRMIGTIQDITERKLVEEDLHLLSNIIDQTHQPVVIGGLGGNLVRFNKAFENLTGYTARELEQMLWQDLTPKRWHEAEAEHFQELVSTGRSVRFEKEYRRKDGSTVPVELFAEMYESAAGEPSMVFGFVTDITERREAERELHRNEQIVSSTTDMLALLDRNCVYLSANSAYLEAFGKASGEVIGRTAAEVFGDEFFDASIRPRADRCLAGEQIHYQDWFEFPAAGRKYIDMEYSPYLGPDDEVLGFVVTARDITRQRSEAEELERLSVAIDQVEENVVITDAEGTIQYVNPAYERITGYSRDEVIGQNASILESGKHDDSFYQHMWGTLRSGNSWSGRFINKKKDGSLYDEEAMISPVRDASGQTVNYVSVGRDITEELKREREADLLETQYNQAQKLESLGRLVGGVAHDLNNLLSPILGYAEILREDLGSGDRRRDSVDEVLHAGLAARDLVRQLLAFSRKQALEYRPVDMNVALTSFENLLRRTIREDIEIEIVLSAGIPIVMADIGQIEQVIMNLVVNAQDAMPEGGRLTLETTATVLDEGYAAHHPGVEPGNYIMLAVSDTGCGMDEATRDHLFEPFFSTKGEKGTGLGLATVHGIVQQHGGSIWVHSEPGVGSTFKIYLPVSAETAVEEKTHRETATDLRGSETVLLAEDNALVRHLTRTILQRHGYTVLEAESGTKALELLETHDETVQLLLTDLVMPGTSGVELFAQARARHPDLKVLYMSGYTDETVNRAVLVSDSFIQKPFAVQALATKVREVLDLDAAPHRGDTTS